jgi:hypothetical protein
MADFPLLKKNNSAIIIFTVLEKVKVGC